MCRKKIPDWHLYCDFFIVIFDFCDHNEKLRLQLLCKYFYEKRMPQIMREPFKTGSALIEKKL